jgi:hypothetical protein
MRSRGQRIGPRPAGERGLAGLVGGLGSGVGCAGEDDPDHVEAVEADGGDDVEALLVADDGSTRTTWPTGWPRGNSSSTPEVWMRSPTWTGKSEASGRSRCPRRRRRGCRRAGACDLDGDLGAGVGDEHDVGAVVVGAVDAADDAGVGDDGAGRSLRAEEQAGLVEAAEQGAAAGEHDALVDDVGRELGRGALEGAAHGVDDGVDRLLRASRISSEVMTMVLGRPATRSRPLTSMVSGSRAGRRSRCGS